MVRHAVLIASTLLVATPALAQLTDDECRLSAAVPCPAAQHPRTAQVRLETPRRAVARPAPTTTRPRLL